MNAGLHLLARLYRLLLTLYPAEFRAKFGEEMQDVFITALTTGPDSNGERAWQLVWREMRDWPGAVWRAHLRSRKGESLHQNTPTWRPLNTPELLAGLALFILPLISPALKWIFGYQPVINRIGSILVLIILGLGLVIIVLGIKNDFPRWSIPYLGTSIVTLVMLQAVFPLWGLFYRDIQKLLHYGDKTLVARLEYSALLNGFFWLVPVVTLSLLILGLRTWPRTRKLSQLIRQDWTLFSFMLYSSAAFQLELVFEEFIYVEPWKILCRICLALGAWVYFKNADQRKRILALLIGVTMNFWVAAVGKWTLLPLQNWAAFYGNDLWSYRRTELGGVLATWIWVMFFMLLPALLTRIPRTKQIDPSPEETLTTTT